VAIKQEPVVYPLATMIICIIAGFAIMFTMVYRFATITELNCELAAMGQEYETLRDSNRKLQAEIAASINQANIRKIAEERLDMKMPDSYQRIPVKVPKVNYSMVVENKSEEQKTTLLSYLAALLQ
jgi:cell division protein FtsL